MQIAELKVTETWCENLSEQNKLKISEKTLKPKKK